MMNCHDAQALLDLLSDEALSAKDSALVLDHLNGCDDCRSQWTEMEELHSRMQLARRTPEIPSDLMKRIDQALAAEERSGKGNIISRRSGQLALTAVAAGIVIIGMLAVPRFNRRSAQPSALLAQALVQEAYAQSAMQPVDKDLLAGRLGYAPIYLRLPEWQMHQAAVLTAKSKVPIARFDFVKNLPGGQQHLTCYQAPQGTIEAPSAQITTVAGKQVRFGEQGKLQFALWSQDGRDYLFVTALKRDVLTRIVRGA